MNVVGPINSPSCKGHKFILAMTDYFSKLAEAISLKEVKAENVVNFTNQPRICVLAQMISNNGSTA